jgi:hypothetical protein
MGPIERATPATRAAHPRYNSLRSGNLEHIIAKHDVEQADDAIPYENLATTLTQKNTDADVENDASAKINVEAINTTIEKISVFLRPTSFIFAPITGEKIRNANDCIARIDAASWLPRSGYISFTERSLRSSIASSV